MREKLGRRGSSLLLFGAVWITLSYGFFVGRLGSAPDGIFQFVPDQVIGIGWVITGLISIACAFRKKLDWLGFTALMVMPAIRATAFLWSWIVYLFPGGLEGSSDGFVQTTVYGLICALIYRIGGWPEALELPDMGNLRHPDDEKGGA